MGTQLRMSRGACGGGTAATAQGTALGSSNVHKRKTKFFVFFGRTLARPITSSSVSNRMIAATGPNISSETTALKA